jgi:hypothetical protein
MKKPVLLKWINLLLFFGFFGTSIGILLYRWGPESLRGSETMYNVHSISGLSFLIIAILHLILNWKWIKNTFIKKSK